MADTQVTIIGGVVRSELKYLPSGMSLCEFSVAVNERVKNKDTGQWEDGDTSYFDCTAFSQLGENIAESIEKGSRVIVIGKLKMDSWQNDAGEKRSKIKVIVDACGPELRFATAQIQKITREGAGEHRQGQSANSAPPAGGDNPY